MAALEAIGLCKSFSVRTQRILAKPKTVRAVTDVSFRLEDRQTLGIVEPATGHRTVSHVWS